MDGRLEGRSGPVATPPVATGTYHADLPLHTTGEDFIERTVMQMDIPEVGTGTAGDLWPAALARGVRLRGQAGKILPYPAPPPQRGSGTARSCICTPVETLAPDRCRITGSARDGVRYARLRAGETT